MYWKDAKTLARKLRANSTQAEKILWEQLRNRKFLGAKFTRQKPISYSKFDSNRRFFIVDFYCAEHKLILEVDGGYHLRQIEADEERQKILELYGYMILRFTNTEVLTQMQSVLSRIGIEISK